MLPPRDWDEHAADSVDACKSRVVLNGIDGIKTRGNENFVEKMVKKRKLENHKSRAIVQVLIKINSGYFHEACFLIFLEIYFHSNGIPRTDVSEYPRKRSDFSGF